MSAAHMHVERTSGGGVDRGADRRRLGIVLALTATYMVAEALGGWWTGSLALLADAGHMLTDVASLGLALAALWMARRPATTRHTYAFARVEVLAALINGVALWIIVAFLSVEAVARLRDVQSVRAGPMLAIAAGGLAVNALALWILRGRGADGGLNLRGASLHVAGDLLGSLGALVAGIVIRFTGWEPADPLAGLLIGILILVSSWRLVREAIHVLMEGAPSDLDVEALMRELSDVEGVIGVHDLHVWTITSGYPALSAHVECPHGEDKEMLLARVNRVLRESYSIEHTTIQIEAQAPPGHDEPMSRPVSTVE